MIKRQSHQLTNRNRAETQMDREAGNAFDGRIIASLGIMLQANPKLIDSQAGAERSRHKADLLHIGGRETYLVESRLRQAFL